MEGVLALMIPIVAVGGFFAWMITLSPVGKAYAEKLRGHKGPSAKGMARRRCSNPWSNYGARWRNWRSG